MSVAVGRVGGPPRAPDRYRLRLARGCGSGCGDRAREVQRPPDAPVPVHRHAASRACSCRPRESRILRLSGGQCFQVLRFPALRSHGPGDSQRAWPDGGAAGLPSLRGGGIGDRGGDAAKEGADGRGRDQVCDHRAQPCPGQGPVDAVQPDQGGLLAVRDQGDVGIQDREPLPARIAGLPTAVSAPIPRRAAQVPVNAPEPAREAPPGRSRPSPLPRPRMRRGSARHRRRAGRPAGPSPPRC